MWKYYLHIALSHTVLIYKIRLLSVFHSFVVYTFVRNTRSVSIRKKIPPRNDLDPWSCPDRTRSFLFFSLIETCTSRKYELIEKECPHYFPCLGFFYPSNPWTVLSLYEFFPLTFTDLHFFCFEWVLTCRFSLDMWINTHVWWIHIHKMIAFD